MDSTDELISQLYRSTKRVDISNYKRWALSELQSYLNVDAAIWSTGHLSTRTFHTHTTLNLPTNFPDLLIENIKINPITNRLFAHAGKAVDMADVIDDESFFDSEIYRKVFEIHKINRILSSIHIDSRSGIYTLLSVYRFNRDKLFSEQEKQIHQRILYHLIEASSHACIMSLEGKTDKPGHEAYHAICDRYGIYHEVEPEFLDIFDTSKSEHQYRSLPFKLPIMGLSKTVNNHVFTAEQLGDLYRIQARKLSKLDTLTKRELEVVTGISKGLSFKLIAKQLSLSPSTVSNHLYRIYNKLEINNRAELARLFDDN